MLADEATYQTVLDGKSLAEVRGVFEAELAAFRKLRATYMLYGE
jgi:hypothetical protein